jgi:hypothetical protein
MIMTKDNLINSAQKLNQPAIKIAAEFGEQRERLAAAANQKMLARPDLEKLIGPGNQLMMEDNNRNFARFMESIFYDYKPEVLVNTVLWVFRAYRSHGFKSTHWPANLNVWIEIMRQELSPEAFGALYPFYNWLIINITLFVKLSDGQLDAGQSKHQG